MSIHFHKLAVKDVRRETAESISVSFEVPDDVKPLFQFTPGQNITVRTYINEVDIRRSYSICSNPYDNELRIAVKEATGGVFSSWANRQLVKGHILDVLPPTGRFTIHPDRNNKKKYLAIAAGSGITPVLSIISSILLMEPGSSCTLLYGNRNRASIMFREHLLALKNQFMPRFALHQVLSREVADADIYSGRITALKCEEFSGQLIDFLSMDEIFICGPESMIFEIRDWLLRSNIPPNKIHYELFTTPVLARQTGVATGATAKNPLAELSAGDHVNQAVLESGKPLSPEPGSGEQISPQGQLSERGSADMKTGDAVHGLSGQVSGVRVKLDGLSFDFKLAYEGETILEAALKQGADLPFSCKGGVCSTCRARLIRGEVRMDLNYALEQDEVDAGFILCCQSHPQSPEVVIDFDQK